MLYLGRHVFLWWNENIRVGDYCLDINKSAHTKIKQQKTNASTKSRNRIAKIG
jgi:hypothetical protein